MGAQPASQGGSSQSVQTTTTTTTTGTQKMKHKTKPEREAHKKPHCAKAHLKRRQPAARHLPNIIWQAMGTGGRAGEWGNGGRGVTRVGGLGEMP